MIDIIDIIDIIWYKLYIILSTHKINVIQTWIALNLMQMTLLLKIQNRFVLTLLASCENWWCAGNCQLDHLQYPKTQPETKRATNLVFDFLYFQKIWSDKFYSEPCQVQYLGFHLGKKRTERRFHHICFCDFHLKRILNMGGIPAFKQCSVQQ